MVSAQAHGDQESTMQMVHIQSLVHMTQFSMHRNEDSTGRVLNETRVEPAFLPNVAGSSMKSLLSELPTRDKDEEEEIDGHD
jgi:hypothetical protein